MAEIKNYIKIGELSKLFHIGVDSIRYYEKLGLIHPIRVNSYRYYSMKDIETMNTIRELLSLGFSTEEIIAFEKNKSVSHVLQMLENELSVVDKSIEQLEHTRNSLRDRVHSIRKDLKRDASEEISIKNFLKRPCLMISGKDIPDDVLSYKVAESIDMNGLKPATIGACDCYTMDTSKIDETGDFASKNVFLFSEELPYTPNFFLPAGKYLSLCYNGEYSKTPKLYKKLVSFAKAKNIEIVGDLLEFCHIDEYETLDVSEYLTELQVMVQEKD